jgi:uncharacterized protein YunC (DUF1805 family)
MNRDSAKVTIKELSVKGMPATGVTVQWDDGQFVFIACKKGVVACGAIDVPLMSKHEQGILTAAFGDAAKGIHLIWPEDLLKAPMTVLSDKAKQVGIKAGMIGQKVLEILADLK